MTWSFNSLFSIGTSKGCEGLCCQFFERENGSRNHMTQGINEQIGTLPTIKPEFHLFEIGREMLDADSVPRSGNAAFEERESGFYSIGVNISHDVDAFRVGN